MNRAWSFRSAVTADTARKRELLEEGMHALLVFALVGVNLGVRAFQIYRGENARSSMTGSCKKDHIQVVLFDEAIEMNVDERQTRTRSPVAKKTVLDVLRLQRLPQ